MPITKSKPRTNGTTTRGRTKPANNGKSTRTNTVRRSNMGFPIASAGRNNRPTRAAPHTFSGSDFLTKVVVKSAPAAATDRILLSQDISPSAFIGTRLTQLSTLWERYRFTRLSFRYVPAVPTTLACQLVGYFDTDPNDNPDVIANVDALIRQAVAHSGAQQWNFIAPHSVSLPQRSDDQLYYTGRTDANERFNLQGKFFLVQVTNPVSFEGNALPADLEAGSLYVDWSCKFQVDQIDSDSVGSLEAVPTFVPTTLAKFTRKPEGYVSPTPQVLDEIVTLTGLKPNALYAIVLTFMVDTNFDKGQQTAFRNLKFFPLRPDASFNNQLVPVGGAGLIALSISPSNSNTYPVEWWINSSEGGVVPGGFLLCRTNAVGSLSVGVDDSAGLSDLLAIGKVIGFTLQRVLV